MCRGEKLLWRNFRSNCGAFLGAESRLDLLVEALNEGREQRLDDKRETQMGYGTLILYASDCNCISETLLRTYHTGPFTALHAMPSGKKEPNISGFSFAAG